MKEIDHVLTSVIGSNLTVEGAFHFNIPRASIVPGTLRGEVFPVQFVVRSGASGSKNSSDYQL
jgi:hypothetical protein